MLGYTGTNGGPCRARKLATLKPDNDKPKFDRGPAARRNFAARCEWETDLADDTMMTSQIPAPRRVKRLGTAAAFAVGVLGLVAAPAYADPVSISVELNKLEPQDKGCRAYIVVDNTSSTGYQAMKLDLVIFQPDGVIGRRVAVDLAPLKPSKKTVKLFDLDGTQCDKIGSLLINDIVECKSDAGPVDQCLAGLKVTSLTSVQLSK